jgi:hypothetical protein
MSKTVTYIVVGTMCAALLTFANTGSKKLTVAAAQQTTCAQMKDTGATDTPSKSIDISSAIAAIPNGGCLEISGHIVAGQGNTIFLGEDGVEKIFNYTVTKPTVLEFHTVATAKGADLNVSNFRVPAAGADNAGDADIQNSADFNGTGGTPISDEDIGPNVVLPGGSNFVGVSDFDCQTCGTNATPVVSDPTDYILRITAGGTTAELNIDHGTAGDAGALFGRFTSALGTTYVNQFSFYQALGLSAPMNVTVKTIRVMMFDPSVFGVTTRPPIAGQKVRFVAFTATKGAAAPPNNPTLVFDQVLTIPGSNNYLDFAVTPFVVRSDQELYVGYFVADPANSGVNFEDDCSAGSGRTFFAGGSGNATAVLNGWKPETGFSSAAGLPCDVRLRILVAYPPAPIS